MVKAYPIAAAALAAALALSSCGMGDTASGQPVSSPEAEESSMQPEYVKDFTVVSGGKACAIIVVPDYAKPKENAAAKDLCDYIERMTGVKPDIVKEKNAVFDPASRYILIGNTDKTAALGVIKETGYPGTERAVIRHIDNCLVICGNDDGCYFGTQHAVTMLLELCGCGWYGPDELWQVVPEKDVIDFTALDIDHVPRFSSRITRVFNDNEELALRWYESGDKSLTGHWLYQAAPAELYSEHPDWFALHGNTRDPSKLDYWQFCYSNKSFAQFIGEKIVEYFDDHTDLVSMTVTANDGWNEGWCECDECSALGNAGDQMVAFANAVAAVVAEKHPDRLVHILSYHKTFLPPQNSVALADNVELMFCRESSMTAPLDTGFTFAAGEDRITHVSYTQSWKDNFAEYTAKTSAKHTAVWEWYCISASAKYWSAIPWVQGDTATRNQELWASLGVSKVYYDHGPEESYHEASDSYALRWPLWYVADKAAWDGTLTGSEILADACSKLYGEASDEMLAYYTALAEASENCTAYTNVWVPCTVKEMYGAYAGTIEQKAAAARALLDSVGEKERLRIENQLSYWENAKKAMGYKG